MANFETGICDWRVITTFLPESSISANETGHGPKPSLLQDPLSMACPLKAFLREGPARGRFEVFLKRRGPASITKSNRRLNPPRFRFGGVRHASRVMLGQPDGQTVCQAHVESAGWGQRFQNIDIGEVMHDAWPGRSISPELGQSQGRSGKHIALRNC